MSALVMPILFGGLISWSLYRRVRRNIGRQPLRPRRIAVSIIIFVAVSLLFLSVSLHQPAMLLGLGGGLLLGGLLGGVGLRLTRFETTDAGHFYTPNIHIGIALTLLFLGRLAYRFWVLRDVTLASGQPAMMNSPLTFFLFGLIAGYSIIYYLGLYIHTRDKK